MSTINTVQLYNSYNPLLTLDNVHEWRLIYTGSREVAEEIKNVSEQTTRQVSCRGSYVPTHVYKIEPSDDH